MDDESGGVTGSISDVFALNDPTVTEPNCVSLLRDERNFIANVSQFYDQEALSDIILVLKKPNASSVSDTSGLSDVTDPQLIFFAHKFVLAKSSDVFRTMLYDEAWISPSVIETDVEDSPSEHTESGGTPSPASSASNSPSGRQHKLKLEESFECCAVFGLFLRYLYTAEIRITVTSAVGILCLADKYNVNSLKELTVQYMIKNSRSPRVNNALNWYSWAKALNLTTLLTQCARTVAWNCTEVLRSPMWLQMDFDFVSDILQSSELVVQQEHDVFMGLKAWLFHESRFSTARTSVTDDDVTEHDKILETNAARLLPFIRLPQMFVYELYKLEADEDISQTPSINKILSPLLSKAYRFRALCERQASLGVEFADDDFYMPRDYLQLSFENVRMQNTLRFGLQVDVKTYKGAAPCEQKDADWKLTYRKQGHNWHIQLYSHESALQTGEARVQVRAGHGNEVSVLIYNEALKVIQVHREHSTTITRGNSYNLEMAIEEPDLAKQIGIILKPVPT